MAYFRFDRLTRGALYERLDRGRLWPQATAQKMYFDYQFGENNAIYVVVLSPAFLSEIWDSYFVNGLHFSVLGNQVVAQVLFDRVKKDAVLQ